VTNPDRRRLRRYQFDPNWLMKVLNGAAVVLGGPLPDDAYVHHICFDLYRDGLSVFVHSMEFDPVPDGEVIPEAGPLCVRLTRDIPGGKYA
jgi:hypothetical protein